MALLHAPSQACHDPPVANILFEREKNHSKFRSTSSIAENQIDFVSVVSNKLSLANDGGNQQKKNIRFKHFFLLQKCK